MICWNSFIERKKKIPHALIGHNFILHHFFKPCKMIFLFQGHFLFQFFFIDLHLETKNSDLVAIYGNTWKRECLHAYKRTRTPNNFNERKL